MTKARSSLLVSGIVILAVLAVIAGVWGVSIANATNTFHGPPCTPIYETQDNPNYVPAVDQWYSWTGGQSATHPFPSSDWNPDNGNHNGQPFQGHINEAFQVSQGQNASWFYHQVTAAIGDPTIQVQVGENCPPPGDDPPGDDPPGDDPPGDDPPGDDPPADDPVREVTTTSSVDCTGYVTEVTITTEDGVEVDRQSNSYYDDAQRTCDLSENG